MNHLRRVRRVDGVGELTKDRDGELGRERSSCGDEAVQGLAMKELHRDPRETEIGVDPGCHHGHDVIARDAGRDLGLLGEPVAELSVPQELGADHLERALRARRHLLGDEDRAHAALGELALHAIVATDEHSHLEHLPQRTPTCGALGPKVRPGVTRASISRRPETSYLNGLSCPAVKDRRRTEAAPAGPLTSGARSWGASVGAS